MADDAKPVSQFPHVLIVSALFSIFAVWDIGSGIYEAVQAGITGDVAINFATGLYCGAFAYGLIERKRWSLYLIWPILIFLLLTIIIEVLNYGVSRFTSPNFFASGVVFYIGWALYRVHEDGYFSHVAEGDGEPSN